MLQELSITLYVDLFVFGIEHAVCNAREQGKRCNGHGPGSLVHDGKTSRHVRDMTYEIMSFRARIIRCIHAKQLPRLLGLLLP